MYALLRMLLGGLFFGAVFLVIRKTTVRRKGLVYGIAVGVLLVITELSALVPFENLFVTFPSAESVWRYYHFAVREVDVVIPGETCDLVIGEQGKTNVLLIVPKGEKGWKLAPGWKTEQVAVGISDGGTATVYRYRGTDEYFVTVQSLQAGELTVTDSCGTQFIRQDDNFSCCYANVPNWNRDYQLIVNGSPVTFP